MKKNLIIEDLEKTEKYWVYRVKEDEKLFAEVNVEFGNNIKVNVNFATKLFLILIIHSNGIYLKFNKDIGKSWLREDSDVSLRIENDNIIKYEYNKVCRPFKTKSCLIKTGKEFPTEVYLGYPHRDYWYPIPCFETIEAATKIYSQDGINRIQDFRTVLNDVMPIERDAMDFLIEKSGYPLNTAFNQLVPSEKMGLTLSKTLLTPIDK